MAVSPGDDEGPFIPADTPINNVHISIEGLCGSTRAAALTAASAIRSSRSLGELNDRVQQAANHISSVAAGYGDTPSITVAPGSEHGHIHVAIQQPDGWRVSCDGDADFLLNPKVNFQAEQRVPASSSCPSMRFGFGGLLGTDDSASAVLQLSPLGLVRDSIASTFELGINVANKSQKFGPCQRSQLGAVTFSDPSCHHAVRLEAAARELLPDEGASEALLRKPLQTTKTSVAYRYQGGYLEPISRTGSIVRTALELSGLLGDVALTRAEALWLYQRRLLGGFWNIVFSAGAVVPLSASGSTPLEDRFFLGGTTGPPSERLPGYCSNGIGLAGTRQPTTSDDKALGIPVDHIGGDARLAASTTLQLPLPLPKLLGLDLCGFLFGAGGALADKVRLSLPRDLLDSTRASAGLGVGAMLPGGGMVGLSWAWPLLSQGTDAKERLQFWLSLHPRE